MDEPLLSDPTIFIIPLPGKSVHLKRSDVTEVTCWTHCQYDIIHVTSRAGDVLAFEAHRDCRKMLMRFQNGADEFKESPLDEKQYLEKRRLLEVWTWQGHAVPCVTRLEAKDPYLKSNCCGTKVMVRTTHGDVPVRMDHGDEKEALVALEKWLNS